MDHDPLGMGQLPSLVSKRTHSLFTIVLMNQNIGANRTRQFPRKYAQPR